MKLGANVDAPRYADIPSLVGDLSAVGVRAVRTVLRQDDATAGSIHDFFMACNAVDIETLGVVARESADWDEQPTLRQAHDGGIELWQRFNVAVDYWQLCNEPDQVGPSSWTLPPSVVDRVIQGFGMALPSEARIVGPGLASGQPYDYNLTRLQGWARHCYVTADGYNGPRPPDGWSGLTFITEYPANEPGLLTKIAQLGAVDYCFAFCWDREVPAYSLVGGPTLAEFRRIAAGDVPPIGGTMKLEEVAAKYGGVYGKPVVLAGTATNPKARIGWVNGVENGYVLEINGEAADAVYSPKA